MPVLLVLILLSCLLYLPLNQMHFKKEPNLKTKVITIVGKNERTFTIRFTTKAHKIFFTFHLHIRGSTWTKNRIFGNVFLVKLGSLVENPTIITIQGKMLRFRELLGSNLRTDHFSKKVIQSKMAFWKKHKYIYITEIKSEFVSSSTCLGQVWFSTTPMK